VTFFAGIHREETTVYTENGEQAAQMVKASYPGCLIDRVKRV
jgi:hypothetical protein